MNDRISTFSPRLKLPEDDKNTGMLSTPLNSFSRVHFVRTFLFYFQVNDKSEIFDNSF